MNYIPRNGQLRDPDFTRHKLYHPNQQQYLQHAILCIILNISTIAQRTRLTRVQLQHPIKQVGLTMHSKASFVRNSDKDFTVTIFRARANTYKNTHRHFREEQILSNQVLNRKRFYEHYLQNDHNSICDLEITLTDHADDKIFKAKRIVLIP